jgi:uncharacterized protein YbjT (DUF2867 family)
MKVLVTGGTGFIGAALSRELASRGHDVVALARHPEDADFAEANIEVVAGDVTAIDSLREPMEGVDWVVNLVALSPLFKPRGGDQKHFEVHLEGTENVVEAAEDAGVKRIVQMSALGADPEGTTAYIRSKGEAEAVVRDSSLDWVVFRPSVIFGDGGEFVSFTKKLAPPYLAVLPGGGKTRFQPIWRGDLVAMLADAATGTVTGPHAPAATDEDPHVGRIYELGGPEVLTMAEVAELAHRADGRPVTVIPVPMALAGVGLKTLDVVPGVPMGADQYRSLKFDNTTESTDYEAFGYDHDDLRTLREYLGLETEREDEPEPVPA